jgi:hypothetical protein
MVRFFGYYHSEDTIFWISQFVFAFSYDPTRRESRRTSDPVLSRDQGSRLQFHSCH